MFRGAKHLVQLVDAHDDAQARRVAQLQAKVQKGFKVVSKSVDNDNENYDDDDDDDMEDWNLTSSDGFAKEFILMEHLQLGELSIWLGRASENDEVWPDRALWHLFQCRTTYPFSIPTDLALTLINRAVVQGLIGMAYPSQEAILRDEEGVPLETSNLVHFDIDVKNGKLHAIQRFPFTDFHSTISSVSNRARLFC